MTYRVLCNLDIAFQRRTEAKELFKAVKQAIGKAQGLDAKMETNSVYLEIHKCYHDSKEPKPCEMIEAVDSLPIEEA